MDRNCSSLLIALASSGPSPGTSRSESVDAEAAAGNFPEGAAVVAETARSRPEVVVAAAELGRRLIVDLVKNWVGEAAIRSSRLCSLNAEVTVAAAAAVVVVVAVGFGDVAAAVFVGTAAVNAGIADA